ncbi:MAG: flagellar hook-associated protein FlgK [Methylovulum sp.]|nr:flagellar hook-associated protein FlgK [Methylovulum sp.]
MAGILGISLSGLVAAQQALDTTGHNIANVNTEGYSRQRVDLSQKEAQFNGSGYIGQGVSATISRVYDQFITHQLTSSTSAYSEADTLSTLASQVDSMVSGEATSVSPALKSFFSAVNEVANDPTSLPVREVMLADAKSLSQHFNTLSTQFEDSRKQTNNQMGAMLDDVNAYAQNIAHLNDEIVLASSRASDGQLPNDLLDQRDAMVAKIAEKVSVSTLPQQDGSVSVFIGSGQSLVLGGRAATLALKGSSTDVTHKNILMDGQDITQQITGGELSGILKFQGEILDPAQQQMGLLAAGFAVQFNEAHAAGFDLNAQAGKALFDVGTPTVTAGANTVGTITTSYDARTMNQLAASDYQLSYDGSNFSLKRLGDNTVSAFPGPPPTTIDGPGFKIETAATVEANDSFLIRPTFNAAQNMASLITDPAEIAASSSADTVPGDNTTALALAALENKAVMFGGNATFNGVNSQLVAKVGTLTSSAKVSSAAQQALFNLAKESRESLSGVNLDEEAANLIKFKQSYQAAAQAISIASSLFDTLLGAMR